MKQIITGEELKEKMEEGILLLCDTVASTLGPVGSNVLISNATSPFITNDGVTIAENIESDDRKINAVLEIAKEASLKTNEVVGDGTTTTLVLLKYLFLEGRKVIENKKSGIILKKELQMACEKVKNILKKNSRPTTEKDYSRIAAVSSNDKEIGNFLWEAYKKVGRKSAIRLEESKTKNTYFKIEKGYRIEINNLPNYYKKEEDLEIKNSRILLLNGNLEDLELLSGTINAIISENTPLLIISEWISEEIKHELYSINEYEGIPIYFIEIPDYASRKMNILNDISILTRATIIESQNKKIEWQDLGVANNIKIEKDFAILNAPSNDLIENHKKKLKASIKKCESDYEKEFLEERLAKFTEGICTIYVGGTTKTETKEKKARMEDGIHALEVAKEGIIIGEGIGFFQASQELNHTDGEKILQKVLQKPLEIILENAGLEKEKIINTLKENNWQKVYNIEKNTYEEIEKTDIIDPLKVEIYALENAISIASMLLTTSHIVIQEKENITIEEI